MPIQRFETKTAALAVLLLALSALTAQAEEPSDAERAYTDGRAALRARDHTAAVEAFERAAALAPDDVDIRLYLGIARSALQDWAGAVEAYERALELDPAHSRALNNLGNVYFRQGLYEESARYYARAVEADPEYLLATFHHGRALWQLNRSEEAEPLFRRCLELPAANDRERVTQLDCTFYLGTLSFREKDFTTAAAIMLRVVQAHPTHPEARYYLGMAYRGLGNLEQARIELDEHRRLLRRTRRAEPIEKQTPR